MIWLMLVLVAGFLLAVPFLGADSRDGHDWKPLRLPSPVPDTTRPPLPPTGASQVAKELRAKLVNWRARRQPKVGHGRTARGQVGRLSASSWAQIGDVIGRLRPNVARSPALAEARPAPSTELGPDILSLPSSR